jgi:LPXTG-motif cell wall-anchored protein
MKRIAIAMAGATLVVLALSGPATAGYPPSPTPSETQTSSVGPTETDTPSNSPSGSVLGETVTVSPGTGGTAFTGSDVMGPLALGGVLLVVGLALLYVSRRRATVDDR